MQLPSTISYTIERSREYMNLSELSHTVSCCGDVTVLTRFKVPSQSDRRFSKVSIILLVSSSYIKLILLIVTPLASHIQLYHHHCHLKKLISLKSVAALFSVKLNESSCIIFESLAIWEGFYLLQKNSTRTQVSMIYSVLISYISMKFYNL